MNTAEVLVEKFSSDPVRFDFLSPERQQQYELLLHLVANLGQPVFLSGPEGIGKSAFLAQLRDHHPPEWQVLMLSALPETTLDEVKKALAAVNNSRRQEIRVLALDDAGCLAPGVLDQICRFVVQDLGFGLVAALRPDELHLKAVSDPWAVGEAQVIELPPLNEQQCADYFERLWLKRGRGGEPDPELVQEVYRRTHGVPGWIQEEALELFGRPALPWRLALAKPIYLALAVIGSAAIAVTAYWQQKIQPPAGTSSDQTVALAPKSQVTSLPEVVSSPPSPTMPQAEVSPPSLQPEVEEGSQPAGKTTAQVVSPEARTQEAPKSLPLEAPKAEANPPPAVGQRPLQVAETPKPPVKEAAKAEAKPQLLAPVPTTPPAKPELPKVAETQKPEANNPPQAAQDAASEVAKASGVQSREWVLKRPAEHFALQIGFFQDPKALAAFARKHPQLRPLAYYPKGKGYVLLYGSFSSIDEVQRAIRKLPPEVGQASIWRFKSVQEAVRASSPKSVKEN